MEYLLLTDVGGKIELEEVAEGKTKFIFTFYHRPKNLMGWLMNPMIKMDQKKNRLKALDSIKGYAETGKAKHDQLIFKKGSREMDFTGKVMRGFLFIDPDGFDKEDDLDFWIEKALYFNEEIR